jgi:GH15 family glucan-1,4-alpha-glucosidase
VVADGDDIGSYALIGDCRTAALVSRTGAIDWLCLPHFSSPSVFGALLDRERGGSFSIRPTAAFRTERRYVDATNVLETTFHTDDATLRVTDLMPVPSRDIGPLREILRIVEGVRGTMQVAIDVDPRPDYGRMPARSRSRGGLGTCWQWGDSLLWLLSSLSLPAGDSGPLHANAVIRAHDKHFLSLGYSKGEVGAWAPLGADAEERLRRTLEWWRSWASACTYRGEHRDQVLRSALALKLMTYVATGAVVAAPTASLPETLGGDRNWDYRYCWLRDAALTMRAFTGLGYMQEGERFLDWLLHTTRLTWPELGVLYDIYGRTGIPEAELDHWRGFANSRPVRIGNAASKQLQLDIYGSVLSAAADFVRAGGSLQRSEGRLLSGFGRTVCRQWTEPDHGIWEIRGARRHYTSSKMMCWIALRSLLALAERDVPGVRIGDSEPQMHAIDALIEGRGFSNRLSSYTALLDGNEADASLLLAGCLGYRPADHPRMRGTCDFILSRLSCNDLLYRYEPGFDGSTQPEGAFGICSFWAVDNLARRGDVAEARRLFHHLMRFANDVGLYGEEIDPHSGAALGNYPQAFTHVGLITAALALQQAKEGA